MTLDDFRAMADDDDDDDFNVSKAPMPWFGGKSRAAPAVWAALGDVPHYVEPFAGSLAVLLNRPHEPNRTYFSETVNDLDGFLVNAWRSIQRSPGATAEAASNPVAEADLMARHLRLLRWRAETDLERLMGDPAWHDPEVAGWWLWGLCCWIGAGWCSGEGPWQVEGDGRVVRVARSGAREPGVNRKLPQLGNDGRGVNTAAMREPGVEDGDVSEYHPVTMPRLRHWFGFLSARLRHVRILNGDWKRSVTPGAAWPLTVRQGAGPCGVFLDPPYADSAGRAGDLYTHDSGDVAHAAADWALSVGADPRWRIVFAGYDGEHGTRFRDAGWREVEWFAAGFLTGGLGNQKVAGHQQHRERLWCSPACLAPAEAVNRHPLFAGLEDAS